MWGPAGVGARSGRGQFGRPPLGQGLEVDGQRLFFWVGGASVLLFSYYVSHQHPKRHQHEPQNVGQDPLRVKVRVGRPAERERPDVNAQKL